MFAPLFVVVLGLFCCSKESSQSILGRPQLFGPSEALVKSVVEFQCQLQRPLKNESILLELFKEGNRDKLLAEYTSLDGKVAFFPILIRTYYEGNLECVAKAQNNSKIQPTVSYTHYLKVVEPVKGAQIHVSSGSVEFFEGKTLELRCDVTKGNHVSYEWLLNGQRFTESPLHYIANNHLLIYRTTSKDSGSYMCVATNDFNKTLVFTSNSSVAITVKDVVSNPDISFTVLKEDSHNYSAVVACQSTKGTPPVTFSLYNRTELVADTTTEDRDATFKVPLALGRHLGWLQCQASNGDQIAYSKWIPLEVVPVSGPVKMHYDHDIGENYAVTGMRFYCKAAKGSHPRYQWFLNNTLLHDRGNFYYVVNQPPEQSMLLLSVGRNSTGTYHCEVSDSFDNTTAISSDKLKLDERVNRLPVLVVAVVFGCFAVVVLLVAICCWVGAFKRRRYGKTSDHISHDPVTSSCEERGVLDSQLGLEMERTIAAYEPDASEYEEDADVVNAATGGEFDQTSEASADEWPQIEEEKKTLEDEAVE